VQEVNIVAHSMGGLDARYMLSYLRPEGVRVASLVTIATPHRGSAVADRFFYGLGGHRGLKRAKRFLAPLGLETDALAQLTRDYMNEEFNPFIPDVAGVRYFSYGAAMDPPPGILSPFWGPYKLLKKEEGENDGLVSVESSRWGNYQGTLVGVSHLDLINWSNSVAWAVKGMLGMERRFNAVAFYLGIADMLAKEGL
jgi:triacylglycerol lipase